MTSDRMASSLARPPAFRMTCASPSDSPAYLAGSGIFGGIKSRIHTGEYRESSRRRECQVFLCTKIETYFLLAAITSSTILDMCLPPIRPQPQQKCVSGRFEY